MESSTHIRQRDPRGEFDDRAYHRDDDGDRGRDHVRPLQSARPAARVTPRGSRVRKRRSRRRRGKRVRRMQPRSQSRTASRTTSQTQQRSMSVSQRRAARRARKRTQATRSTSRRTWRRTNILSLLSWRMVSGVIVVGLAAVLYLFLTADAFYVRAVAIGGERYLAREEIFRFSEIAQRHIFWVDPTDVEQRLESVPNIADAQVLIGWPPDMVQIIVVEREPALIWEQEIRVWVDVNGIVMKQREDRRDLLRIVVRDPEEPIAVGQHIPRTVVDGALQFKRRYPDISVLLYEPLKGLGHQDGRGWTVWFGTGDDIDTKLLVYNALVERIYPTTQPGEIDMSDPDRPTYTVLWENG